MSNLDQFAQKMGRLADTISRSPEEVARRAASAYTSSIRKEIKAVVPTGKLSGVGKRGARVGVKYTAGGATAYVQATGPLHLVERDTKGGYTIPRTVGTRRTRTASGRLSRKREETGRNFSGRKVLFFNGRYVTGPIVRKRGTRGRHPFERGVNRYERENFTAAVAGLSGEIRSIFK